MPPKFLKGPHSLKKINWKVWFWFMCSKESEHILSVYVSLINCYNQDDIVLLQLTLGDMSRKNLDLISLQDCDPWRWIFTVDSQIKKTAKTSVDIKGASLMSRQDSFHWTDIQPLLNFEQLSLQCWLYSIHTCNVSKSQCIA